MTPAIVAAVEACHELDETLIGTNDASEPLLNNPTVGSPISHSQLVAVSKLLKAHGEKDVTISCHLDALLRGSRIYYEPPKSKAQPVWSNLIADNRAR